MQRRTVTDRGVDGESDRESGDEDIDEDRATEESTGNRGNAPGEVRDSSKYHGSYGLNIYFQFIQFQRRDSEISRSPQDQFEELVSILALLRA